MAIIYLADHYQFNSIEEMVMQNQKEGDNIPDYLQGITLSNIWDCFERVRFSSNINDNTIEVMPEDKKLLVGTPAFYFWVVYGTSLEAIEAGFYLAQRAEKEGILLSTEDQDEIRRLYRDFLSETISNLSEGEEICLNAP